jgi:hypothetical protein
MGAVSYRALIALALASCGGGQSSAARPQPSVSIHVTPSRTCNRGRPLQAVVRAVTLKQFVEDQDRAVAQLVVSPDESVLSSFVVFPGIEQTIAITPPAKGAFAVYFLFTGATGASWKRLYDTAPSKVQLQLGDNQILATSAP